MKTNYDFNKLNNDLKNFLKRKNLSITEFEFMSGVSKSTLSRNLRGMGYYTIGDVTKIAKTMNKRAEDYIVDIADFNSISAYVYDLSIEEIDDLIAKIKQIRSDKIDQKLKEIDREKERLREMEKLYRNLTN